MKSAVGPPMGSLAALIRRITPAPASNRNTREPSTIAVAGPDISGMGAGLPVPSNTTTVESVRGTLLLAAQTSSEPAVTIILVRRITTLLFIECLALARDDWRGQNRSRSLPKTTRPWYPAARTDATRLAPPSGGMAWWYSTTILGFAAAASRPNSAPLVWNARR